MCSSTPQARSCITAQSIHGPGTLKVKPDTGNYRAIFAASTPETAVNDVTFTGISVDQNAYNNTTATIDAGDDRTHQRIWQIFAGTNVQLERMRLYVSGVNPVDINGPAVSGVYVHRNYIEFQKRAGQPEFDNSAIYINGDNFHVIDNSFVSGASDQARTAIEIHTGSGSVSGNTIDRFSIGMNLVDLKSSSVTGNHIRNAGYGITLWSAMQFQGSRHFPGQNLNAFLSSLGLGIGEDANAETSFDDTQYTLRVPTDRRGALDAALTVLEDWAGGALFADAAIERQRAIVLAEWRRNLGADERTADKMRHAR